MTQRTTAQLRADALAIWQAGVSAVDSRRLVQEQVRVSGRELRIGEESIALDGVRRLVVVGAGKAGAGMAEGLEAALGSRLMAEKNLVGWINVPADCVRPLERIHLHAARPAGVNEPTAAGVEGAQQILELVSQAAADDLCLCLLSGGGSALLPAPLPGISLEDKLAVTQQLSAAGANIWQLNTVRKQLSRLKGGGLAAACRAGRLRTLIISDVLGDPLDVIASGPTVADRATPRDALAVLEQYAARQAGIAPHVFACLARRTRPRPRPTAEVVNQIIGNNAAAVDAAGREAERRGYAHAMVSATEPEGAAEEVGRHLARLALSMRAGGCPDCLITGGEPVVQLVPAAERGLGGRNQQLVLAALEELLETAGGETATDRPAENPLAGIALLSGGTDGEDGPTDAAGAWIDADLWGAMQAQGLWPRAYLWRNDAYPFFAALGTLLKTGPTHTNVCDLRVVLSSRLFPG